MYKFLFMVTVAFNSLGMQSDLIKSKISYDEVASLKSTEIENYLDLNNEMLNGGFNDLLPFVTATVDQEEAGSCLYMSHTGVIEWWLNFIGKDNHTPIDLSERYYMALKTENIGSKFISNWRTDNIYRVNANPYFFTNKQYPFTKSYFTTDPQTQDRIVAGPTTQDATYNAEFNWISFKSKVDEKYLSSKINLPKFKREIIYKDKDDDQWSVAGAPSDIIEKIKAALIKNKAPVNVIYNHHGFWHAVIIVGFNDNAPTLNCPFASGYPDFMNKMAKEQEDEADKTNDEKVAKKLRSSARIKRSKANQVAAKFEQIGGCHEKGVFYVRDSINPDPLMPLYDYDTTQIGEEEYMNSPVIFREYEWFQTTGNHVFQILLDDGKI